MVSAICPLVLFVHFSTFLTFLLHGVTSHVRSTQLKLITMLTGSVVVDQLEIAFSLISEIAAKKQIMRITA